MTNCSKAMLNKLQVLQNKLLKLVLQYDRLTPTNILHKNFNILKLPDIRNAKLVCFVAKCLSNNCPPCFKNYYQLRNSHYNLRHQLLNIKRTRTQLGSSSIQIHGAKLWNNLPVMVKDKYLQDNFKKITVKFYHNQY
jgi:hypothetical protein